MSASTWFAGPYGRGNYLRLFHLSAHWKKDGFGKKDGKILLKKSNSFSHSLKTFKYILSQKDIKQYDHRLC